MSEQRYGPNKHEMKPGEIGLDMSGPRAIIKPCDSHPLAPQMLYCYECVNELRTKVKALEGEIEEQKERTREATKMKTRWYNETCEKTNHIGRLKEDISRLTAERDAKEDILQRFRRYRRCEDTIANAWNALDAHDAERAEVVTTVGPSTKTKAITTNPDG